jgi:hypothetical protein
MPQRVSLERTRSFHVRCTFAFALLTVVACSDASTSTDSSVPTSDGAPDRISFNDTSADSPHIDASQLDADAVGPPMDGDSGTPPPTDSGMPPPPTCARSFYVSSSGSDSNAGTMSSPWRSVGHVNNAPLSAGDCVFFHGGDAFRDTYLAPRSGTMGNPITYGSYGTGQATLGGSVGAVFLSAVHDVVLRDLIADSGGDATHGYSGVASDATGAGCTRINVSGVIVRHWHIGINVSALDANWSINRATIEQIGGSGVIFNRYNPNGGAPPAGRQIGNSITASVIQHTGLACDRTLDFACHGVYDDSVDSVVRGNTITDFDASGISVRFHSNHIEGNDIDGAGRGGIGISFFSYDSAGATTVFAYNTIHRVGAAGIYIANDPSTLSTVESFVIANNTIDLTAGEAINVEHTTGAIHFANNVLTGAVSQHLRVQWSPTMWSEHNDLFGPTSTFHWAFASNSGTTLAGWQAASHQGTSDLATNPMLASDGTLGSGSPAIDRGSVSVPGLTYVGDCSGAVYHYCGPAPDIGAHELR